MEYIMKNNTNNGSYIELGNILDISEKLNNLKDIDSLLDRILFEARKFSNSDAGSIFLAHQNHLHFSYVQNDTLAKQKNSNKYIYTDISISINEQSISGYVAKTGKLLNIPDVHNLPENVPYSFNPSFDRQSSYFTKSALTIPLMTGAGRIVGVMQLINPLDENGEIHSYTKDEEIFTTFLATNASSVIEVAKMTRDNVLRMVQMAGLRDPKETGSHVNRVGSYAIEIYQDWAIKKGIKSSQIKHMKDHLKIAAMLHDVGKVAIPDTVLKKPGKLDDEEFNIMRTHALQGAILFDPTVSELDALSHDIAISHHEKWDGTGYPKRLKGDEIPLAGRICAIADVFDALISKRVYKEKWDEEEVLKHIEEQSGKHFDPEIVESFKSVYEVITAIRNKYKD